MYFIHLALNRQWIKLMTLNGNGTAIFFVVIKRYTKVGQVRPWSHSFGWATEDKKKLSATSNVCALK